MNLVFLGLLSDAIKEGLFFILIVGGGAAQLCFLAGLFFLSGYVNIIFLYPEHAKPGKANCLLLSFVIL